MRKPPRTKVRDEKYRKYLKELLQGQVATSKEKVLTYQKTRFGVKTLKTKVLTPSGP